jgi:ABC-type glycerol-3-phosphate transport system permease component
MVGRRVSQVSVYAVLLVAVTVTLLPVVWMISTSLKPPDQALAEPLRLVPTALEWENYVNAWQQRPFGTYTFNSIIAAGVSTLVTIALSAAAGFGLSRYRYPGRDLLFLLMIATIMIPLEAIVIPLYLQIQAFGWVNTYAGLILPTVLQPIGIFIMRQAMMSVPQELIDAARIDGASEFYILRRIMVPMTVPSIAAVAIFTFNIIWNSYLWPLIAVNEDGLRTLPLGMALFENQLTTSYSEIMAVAVIGSLPFLLLFAVLQRKFVESVTLTGLK